MHQMLKKALPIPSAYKFTALVVVALCCLAANGISAQTLPGSTEQCLACHSEPPASNIVNTVHGNRDNPASPFAQNGCESCHGNSTDHSENLTAPGIVFTQDSDFFPASDAALQNSMCLACHEADDRTLREAGVHMGNGLSCVACHNIHGASP